jgi:hypothetical protein
VEPDVIFSTTRETRTSAACLRLIEQVRGRVALKAQLSAEELTDFAVRAFERYAEGLLEDVLASATLALEPAEHAIMRARRQFSEGLDYAGAALREVLAESGYRHAVSQGLQRKMFEAEAMLRRALKSRFVIDRVERAPRAITAS